MFNNSIAPMKKIVASLLFTFMMMGAMAQSSDPIVFEINGKNYYKSQFMKEFLRSIGQDPAAAPTACTYEKRQALDDYLQLYVNFQAKLTDAYAQGYDTISSINEELQAYRKELAAPYLIDSATMQSLLREAYERNHYVLHAAHILIPCGENASPEDTLKAYNHAMERYRQALTAPNFYTVAQEEMKEQRSNDRDPLVREKANQVNPYEGELGCFTVFSMVYPFESAAYSMLPGQVHQPVRSRFGYHIIKLFDRFEHYGKVQLAHIWISDNDPSAKGKINSAYNNLEEGVDFGMVAKNYSDDRTTSKNGGIMPELAPEQLPVEYIAHVSAGLPIGQYTKPFHSNFGWHIIKLLKKEDMPDFESMVPIYKSRMTRGERATKPQSVFVDQCKEKYHFIDYTTTKVSKKKNAPTMASLDAVRSIVTDSIFSAIFNYDSNAITDMRPLFKIGDKEFNSRQFARYIRKNKKVRQLCPLDIFVQERYNEFIEAKVLEYANSRLEMDNPEFAELIDEYRHGLMIFAYNDQNVWSRAVKDTVGFEQFYQVSAPTHNFNDTNDAFYFWNERARVNIFTVSDSTVLPRAKAMKIFLKGLKKELSSEKMVEALNAKIKDTATCKVGNMLDLVELGNQTLLSHNEWHTGVYVHPADSGYSILSVEKILQPELKTRDEARGFYLNDYQNYLEKANNEALRRKYNIKIHQEVIDAITY